MYNSLKYHAFGMIVLSTIQYLLGQFTSLFVQFPDTKQNITLWKFAWQQVPLTLHIIVGLLLFFGTIVLIIRSVAYKNRTWIIASFTAGIAVLGAAIAGITYIPTQTNTYSFIMAIYFLLPFSPISGACTIH